MIQNVKKNKKILWKILGLITTLIITMVMAGCSQEVTSPKDSEGQINGHEIEKSSSIDQGVSYLRSRGLTGSVLQGMVMQRANGIRPYNQNYLGDSVMDCYGYCRQVWNAIISDGSVHSEDFYPNGYSWSEMRHWVQDVANGLPVNDYVSSNWAAISSIGLDNLKPGDVIGTVQGHTWGFDVHYGIYAGKDSSGNHRQYDFSGDGCAYRLFWSGFKYYHKGIHALLSEESYINPPYLFPNDVQGWTKGNSATDPWWYNVGWPGILITDQTGLDAFIYSPKTNFTARNFPQVVNIDFYPQNGTTSNHEMKMYWKTDDQNNWDESKSSPMKTYTAKDKWLSLNINVDNPLFKTHVVNQLRLDFDHSVNSQTRYIVNHVILQDQIVYSFSSNTQGWTAGHSVTNPWWYNVGWPGILITDQTGTDAFIYSPVLTGDGYPYNYLGASNDKVHVRIYPQNGTTANHEMKIYWITETDTTWDEAKSTSVNYIGQNTWVDIILPVGQNPKWSDRSPHIKQLRLDFDQANTQTRYIVDYIKTEY